MTHLGQYAEAAGIPTRHLDNEELRELEALLISKQHRGTLTEPEEKRLKALRKKAEGGK